MNETKPSQNSGFDAEQNPEVKALNEQGRALIVQAQAASGDEADELRRQAEELFAKAKAKALEWSAVAQQKADEWAKVAEEKAKVLGDQTAAYTKDNPLKAVGIAAAAGLLLGALFNRNKKAPKRSE